MIQSANVLGNPRAESDRLLQKAFLETVEFHALVNTDDFRIVVGRRGQARALFSNNSAIFTRGSRESCFITRFHKNPPVTPTFGARSNTVSYDFAFNAITVANFK